MKALSKLERSLQRVALPHLALLFVIGQVFVALASMLGRLDVGLLLLVPALVQHGEWWRLITFLFVPPPVSFLFIAFAWWLFYLMGEALEHYWGTVRFNLFIFTGWALTVGAAFVIPAAFASNLFLAGSVFLAFAWLNPNFELSLFFILPIKIKWLALLAWLGYAWSFITGGPATRLQVIAAVGNFLLFFGRDIYLTLRYRRRRMRRDVQHLVQERAGPQPRHRCHVCGKTDLSHPQLDFRYCSQCAGDQCYCPEHIHHHEHVRTTDALPPA
ncbi:rhomboid family intramembrane serine protease [Horticoccus luteus]|uniref:Rhomboid family intramembrane serine protease n=1 Tax=Horticoccus luteus TaxID=2862869 RepID=A0A8F9TWW9_9BACT|nr:rhomboid family intramembrane serine protease [Horticoccus luteus]QYM79248.1 rhomboid family intramembrane serine protease [Horticoccus luteus]